MDSDQDEARVVSSRVQFQAWLIISLAIALPTIVTWVYFIQFDGQSAVVGGLGKLLQFGFPVVWIFLCKRLTLRDAELPKQALAPPSWSVRRSLLFGSGTGLAIVLLMVAYYRFAFTGEVFENFVDKAASRVARLSLDNLLGFAALGVFYSIAHSFLEEYYFRWFVFGRLRQLVSFAWAAITSGLAFMAHHVIVLSVFFGFSLHTLFLSFSIAVGGVLWSWHYQRARSLMGPWLSHAVVDAGIFCIGYHMIFHVLPKM